MTAQLLNVSAWMLIVAAGFEWGDAAIGAAAALGLVLAVTGVLVLRREAGSPNAKSTKGDDHAA
jgi:uncharacterized iron-regulated membrane protein